MSNRVVIKVGGTVLEQPQAADALCQTLFQLQQQGYLVTLVHGGGSLVEQQMQAQGLSSEKRDGLRVTPDQHMPVVAGALAGFANKQLVARARVAGLQPVGLSLADADLTQAEALNAELGAVGRCQPGNPALLELLLEQGFMPVVSSIASSQAGRLLNINADDAATVVAQLLAADLVLLSDVDGVLDGNQQLLPNLQQAEIEALIVQQVIRDGMAVKVQAALHTARTLQRSIAIANWAHPERLPALLRGEPVGTRIHPETDSDIEHKANQSIANNKE